MRDTELDRDPLDLLAEEFAQRCRRGEHPPVSEFLQRHPQWAAELREMLPAVAVLESAKRQTTAAHPVPAGGSAPDRLGDFRILRELGRGGMGIVYEAVQESLGRRVALKVLPGHAGLDSQRRQRFDREAAAAARLHHTNIVPVFGVGEHDGLPYYVMQFIPGRGLDQVLADLRQTGSRPGAASAPWDWRAVAALGVQIAEALHHAHLQGVLHRDVKPGNILVDGQGTAWVTDFGLAKLAGEPELTATGDLLGTWHYMAPENFQGQSDARSDIYGLGLVLSELCTLEPPPQTPNPTEFVRRVGGCERPRPRRLNPAIPLDLETVILKATAADPAQRYASARDFAEDLRRFLDDRPVLARRASALRRGWRWCKRNRLVASLAAVALASLVLAAVVGWVGYAYTRDALARERNALAGEAQKRTDAENAARRESAALAGEAQKRAEAENATRRLEANQELFLQAFEEIFRVIAPQDTAPPLRRAASEKAAKVSGARLPAGTEENVALLQAVLDFYNRFAEQNAANTSSHLHHDAAKAYRRVCTIQQRLGHPDKAEAALEHAIALYESLVAKHPEAREYRYELAELCAHSGIADTTAAAEKRLRRAAELADGLRGERDEQRRLRGEVHGRLGSLLSRRGQAAAAEPHHRVAVRLLESVRPLSSAALAAQLRASRLELAEGLLDRGEVGEARPVLRASIRGFEAALTGSRPPPDMVEPLTAECLRLIRLCHRAGAEDSVAELLKKAKKLTPRSQSARRSRDSGAPL
jgi:hypothetical protein